MRQAAGRSSPSFDHLSTRWLRVGLTIERQKGKVIAFAPGENPQLETESPLLPRSGSTKITPAFAKVRSQREQARRSRRRAEIPVVSLSVNTNAGKFNAVSNVVTSQAVYAADQLFATLDPDATAN